MEIHSAHGYLLNQFDSPLTNQRSDDYGGPLDNPLWFLLETVHSVRDAVGSNFLISVRLDGCDYTDGGSTIADSVQAAILLRQAGINLLSVTGGVKTVEEAELLLLEQTADLIGIERVLSQNAAWPVDPDSYK